MIALVPGYLLDELKALAKEKKIDAHLEPYLDEDGAPDPALLDQADAVLRWARGRRFSDLVNRGANVRWLHTESAGVDMVLTEKVRAKKGLIVTDSGPAYEIAISEFVLAWMLMVSRRLPDFISNQRSKVWKPLVQQELYGQTVGVIGLGPIGRGVAQRCKAFGMNTLGFRKTDSSVDGVDQVFTSEAGFRELLEKSDFLVIAAALTRETKRLKPNSWIVNIARGSIIDETALLSALQRKVIAGACLDVFEKEPLPESHPFWEMSNVFIAPHTSSGWSDNLYKRAKSIFIENLDFLSKGLPLKNVVNQERGY
jgi:phosphoglycerate dehydrogenase-like enzyme